MNLSMGGVGRRRAVLDFLSPTEVGRLEPLEDETDAGGEASEWELRGRREWEDEREAEVEALDAERDLGGGAEPPQLLSTPSFMASADEE